MIENFLTKRKSNNKAERTIEYKRLNLLKFDRFLNGKNIKYVTEEDLQRFFKRINSWHTRDRYDLLLIQFFRDVFDPDKKERSENMKWFKYTTKKQKKKQKNPNKKDFLIEPEEHKKLFDIDRHVAR